MSNDIVGFFIYLLVYIIFMLDKADACFSSTYSQNLRLVHNNNLATACHLNSERNSETEIQPHSKHLNI